MQFHLMKALLEPLLSAVGTWLEEPFTFGGTEIGYGVLKRDRKRQKITSLVIRGNAKPSFHSF